MRYKKLLVALYLVSIVAYGTSFLMDSIVIVRGDHEPTVLKGYAIFLQVFIFFDYRFFLDSMTLLIFPWAWFANVAYWIGILLFALRKDRGALLAAEGAVLLAYPVLGMWIWGTPEERLVWGFFVWFGSMVLQAVAAKYRLYFERRKGIGLTYPA
ncbi:MAG TPA: hypothetical protein VGZ47_01525 [Gemmataceae bacterium]|jgi:hypothetical protein|nr:hypothetical protein [Gemmataceae bacterium]